MKRIYNSLLTTQPHQKINITTRSRCCYWVSCIITIYFFLFIHSLASPSLHFCRHDQRDALLEFRDEFPIFDSKPSPWNKSTDCCFWEGVKCDDKSGQVISLDLNTTLLNNSLKTNSSLFRLESLSSLDLSGCNLQGEIPSSLGNLSRLIHLELSSNRLIGKIPSSLGNLSRLSDLKLGFNQLVGEVPASIGNLNELRVISLERNSLSGSIPNSFTNLTRLSEFSIYYNNFTSLPSDMSGFHNLVTFSVSANSLVGPFPKSLFSIPSLELVYMDRNQFTGPIQFENTSSSSKLQYLLLSHNRFDGSIPESISKFPNLVLLFVDNNNISGTIPRSLSKLASLSFFGVYNNKLEGEVPSWVWKLSSAMLSHNSFSSFEKMSSKETLIQVLDLSSNSFRGPFPLWICKQLRGLNFLDLSNNLFSGSIPSCLRNFNLTGLILRNNDFSGTLPDMFANATNLQSLDISRNQLEGKFPKSLINCKALQFLNVEGNKIKDKFPSWLGSLPSLHVLILRSNEFYGPLHHHDVPIGFQSLRIVDISHNGFNGTLPPHFFSTWHEMTTLANGSYEYVEDIQNFSLIYRSMEMVNKGVAMSFERIRQDFRAIDFSDNRLYGEIPDSVGCLEELRILNLSGNAFTSVIPRFLANLTKLETLDLSCNKLSGQIPQDLSKLSFLSYMNFSHNNLQGPVPRGTQFQRQKCSSFSDNHGLYGLEEICGETHVRNPTSQQQEELSEEEENMFNWVAAAIAYGPGVFCGLVIGYIFTSHNHDWFTEKFGRKKLSTCKNLVGKN
ncbi:receptor-like protein 12 [Capsella rubella]|uniref:receptor-like protein 12 n=1 Tax=Capsella rubella TaxID=81985 RepID=UPI000CD4DDE6|nr:receptor-like protein 12 [Capsella rubella]